MPKKITMSEWYHHSHKAWKILVILASTRCGDTSYGLITREIRAGSPQSSRNYLDPIAAYCAKHKLPPLTVLVRHKNKPYIPSPEFIQEWLIPIGATVDEARDRVWGYDGWDQHDPQPADFEHAHKQWMTSQNARKTS